MLQTLQTYGIGLGTFLLLNTIWLNIAAKDLYQRSLGSYLAPEPNILVTLLFSIVFVAALMYFVIWPARKLKDISSALLRAAIFGAICYATLNLTNLANLRDWPAMLVVIDIVWGSVLTTAVTGITLNLLQSLKKK